MMDDELMRALEKKKKDLDCLWLFGGRYYILYF
jgi:hypothetical protein